MTYLYLVGILLLPFLIPLVFVDQVMTWLMRIGGRSWKDLDAFAKWQTFMLGFDLYFGMLAVAFAGSYLIPPHNIASLVIGAGFGLFIGICNALYNFYVYRRWPEVKERRRVYDQWKREHPGGNALDFEQWKRDH